MSLTTIAALLLLPSALLSSAEPTPVPPTPIRVALSTSDADAAANSTLLLHSAQAAAAQGRELDVTSGRSTLVGPVVLPAGLRLKLALKTVLSSNTPAGAVLRLNAGTALSGGTVWNASSTDGMDIELAAAANDVKIVGVHLEGAHANAIYMNQPGLSRLDVTHCAFRSGGYGILLNPGAAGASHLRFIDNTFTGGSGDAIELNAAPGTATASVTNVLVSGNAISHQVGTSDSAGFGVGLSGIANFTVSANTFDHVRSEAVHVEDNSANGAILSNIIRDGGIGTRPAIAIYRTVSHMLIAQNNILRFEGNGIATMWDPSGSSRYIRIDRNQITRVSGAGIVMAGDAGTGPFSATRNRVTAVGGVAIGSYGTHAHSTITNNVITVTASGTPFALRYRGDGATTISGNRVTPVPARSAPSCRAARICG